MKADPGGRLRLYLEPSDIIMGHEADAAIAAGTALPLAPPGRFAFRKLRVRRCDVASVNTDSLPVSRISEWRADLDAAAEAAFSKRLAALTGPRPPLAGLALDRPLIMGIVNVTPDSFSDGGDHADTSAAIAHGVEQVRAGADILDIGGESTRPGAEPVAIDEEIRRTIPVIEGLRGVGVPISIDSRRPEVMQAAAEAGAHIINDVTALSGDSRSAQAAARLGLPVILMHMLGEPRTMQRDPRYDDVVLDVFDSLSGRLAAAEAAGMPPGLLSIDPGIGFGKTLDHNLSLVKHLALFHGLGVPVMLGASRKSFISKLCGDMPPKQRLPGSLAVAFQAVTTGVQLLRVHDVAETRQAVRVFEAVLNAD